MIDRISWHPFPLVILQSTSSSPHITTRPHFFPFFDTASANAPASRPPTAPTPPGDFPPPSPPFSFSLSLLENPLIAAAPIAAVATFAPFPPAQFPGCFRSLNAVAPPACRAAAAACWMRGEATRPAKSFAVLLRAAEGRLVDGEEDLAFVVLERVGGSVRRREGLGGGDGDGE